MNKRRQNWDHVQTATFDVAIIGGGINGACLYHHLCRTGYKVLLADKGDFAAGTSQASGMMIWGGLLYLRNLDIGSVFYFSKARDAMIREMGNWVSARSFRYIPAVHGGRSKHFVYSGLYLYWLLGRFNRKAPAAQEEFGESALIEGGNRRGSLLYEEALLRFSDCRFVLHWITRHQSKEHVPLNYCAVQRGEYSTGDKCWHLDLEDTLGRHEACARARYVVNCSGAWTDKVNEVFGIRTPYKHVLSKGVFIGFERPDKHRSPLIFEMEEHGDVLTYLPWGPVSLWGPTETTTFSVSAGYAVTADDIRFLLRHANKNLRRSLDKSDIISLRCGIRPLAVRKSFNRECYPLDISRTHKIVKDPALPWISLYGGKITGCIPIARRVCAQIGKYISPVSSRPQVTASDDEAIATTTFPGLRERVPTVTWCMEHELCLTLEDYLRRRTNISQWIAREGLGRRDENVPYIGNIALALSGNDTARAEHWLTQYRQTVGARFDAVISNV